MGERIICLGDSITEGIGDVKALGWTGRLNSFLQTNYPDKWHIVNLGVAGDTSIDICHRLLSEVVYREPSILVIAAGLNDVTRRLWPDGLGHKIDIDYSMDVWMKIIRHIKSFGIKTVFVGLTPVNEKLLPLRWMPHDEKDLGHICANEDVKSYNQRLKRLVETAGLPFIDIFENLQEQAYAATLADGLHPDFKGYDMLFEEIIAGLKTTKIL